MLLFAVLALARRLASAAWITAAGLAGHLAGQGAAYMVLLAAFAWLATVTRLAMAAASQKAYGVEDRLNALVPQLPSPKTAPSTAGNSSYGPSNSSYASSNSSYSVSNGSYSDNDGLQGAAPATYQVGTAQGTITRVNNLISAFSALQGDHSSLVPAVNALRSAYSDTVTAFNTHISDHGALVSTVSQLRSSHSDLVTAHNTLQATLQNTRVLT